MVHRASNHRPLSTTCRMPWSTVYTVSQKYTLDVIDCNLKKDDPILVIFGKGEHTLTLSSLTLGIG